MVLARVQHSDRRDLSQARDDIGAAAHGARPCATFGQGEISRKLGMTSERLQSVHMPHAAPFGSWQSPITAASVAAGEVPLGQIFIAGQDVYWTEGKPLEGGRNVVVRCSASGERPELTPAGFNVRTRVHEYGGGSYVVHGSSVFFSNFADQRLYRQDDGGEPRAISPEPETPAALRYADGFVTADGQLLICVQERHPAN